MPRSPSLVPENPRRDVYLELENFGSLGRMWRETHEVETSRSLLEGHYQNPVRTVAFNTAEGWSRDLTFDIADELRRRCVENDEVPASILKFIGAANRH